jgi:hypothetical protein
VQEAIASIIAGSQHQQQDSDRALEADVGSLADAVKPHALKKKGLKKA